MTGQRIEEKSQEDSSEEEKPAARARRQTEAGGKKNKEYAKVTDKMPARKSKLGKYDDEHQNKKPPATRQPSKNIEVQDQREKAAQNPLQAMQDVKDQVLRRSLRKAGARQSQEQRDLQQMVERTIDQTDKGNPMLFFDPQAEAAGLVATGKVSAIDGHSTVALQAQRGHLLEHLVKEKQYTLARDMGARLSQVLASQDFSKYNQAATGSYYGHSQLAESLEPRRAEFLSTSRSRSQID